MELVYLLVVTVIIAVFVLIDRPVMVLKFKEGDVVKSKGAVPNGFLTNCKEIGHKTPFDGEVKVYKNRFKTKIVFSKQVPSKVKQRIRNVFPHQSKLTPGKRA